MPGPDDARRWADLFRRGLDHDLGAPIRATRAFAQLLSAQAGERLSAKERGFLEHIIAGGERLDRMKEAMMEWLRLETRPLELHPCALGALVSKVRDAAVSEFPRAPELVVFGSLPEVIGDEAQLTRLLEVLLDNALRHAPGCTVHVEGSSAVVEGRPSSHELVVWDEGPGISESQLENVMIPLRALASVQSAAGMGLAIAQRIVERHDATLKLERAPDAGLLIRIVFPGAVPAVAAGQLECRSA